MAEDPGHALSAELMAALDHLAPEIEGLELLTHAGMSGEFNALLNQAIPERRRRRELIIALLTAMSLLYADGYPNLPQTSISDAFAEELQKERTAFEAAMAIFGTVLRAAKMEVNLRVASREES